MDRFWGFSTRGRIKTSSFGLKVGWWANLAYVGDWVERLL